MAILLVGLLLGAAGSGPPIERGEATFRPSEAEARVPEPFRLEAARFAYELEPLLDAERYDVAALRFPSPVVTPDPANNTVHAEYFRPKGPGKRPAVVVLHILGADFPLSRYLAARLADRGVAALFVKLPYYGERRGPDRAQRFLSDDVERSVTAMRQGICDVRRASAWLAGRPEVDPARLGVTGISLGGIVAATAGAVDPTIGRVVPILAGGRLDEILWDLPEPAAWRGRKLWIEAGKTREELRALCAPFDPVTHAGRLAGKRVLLMAGTTDEVIPPRCAVALWEAAGRPAIRWLDCGHYSAVGYLLPAIREVVAFFGADLGP